MRASRSWRLVPLVFAIAIAGSALQSCGATISNGTLRVTAISCPAGGDAASPRPPVVVHFSADGVPYTSVRARSGQSFSVSLTPGHYEIGTIWVLPVRVLIHAGAHQKLVLAPTVCR